MSGAFSRTARVKNIYQANAGNTLSQIQLPKQFGCVINTIAMDKSQCSECWDNIKKKEPKNFNAIRTRANCYLRQEQNKNIIKCVKQ